MKGFVTSLAGNGNGALVAERVRVMELPGCTHPAAAAAASVKNLTPPPPE